jgi:hypothetical protein
MQTQLTATAQGIEQQNFVGSPVLRKLLRLNPEYNLHRVGSPNRRDVEHHIADVFAKTYGAEVTEFAPFLMSMVCAGNISAAAGIRPANSGPLFLEQNLDDSVEQVFSNCYGHTIGRHEIFELGNLAALRTGVCQLFYLIMAGAMARTKLNYVVFAGTKQVAKGLDRLGFHMQSIVAADPARLGDAAENWGSYYESAPQIMAIDLRESMEALSEQTLPSAMLNIYERQITELANHFNSVYRRNLH